jgi:hypothetical protein
LASASEPTFAKLPATAAAPAAFIPRGWELEDQIKGDLNGDGIADLVLQEIAVVPKTEKDPDLFDRSRMLVVLLKQKNGYKCIGMSKNCLLSTQSGGVKGAMITIKISKGILVIENAGGSRELSTDTLRFRYDPKMDKLMLIGIDRNVVDTLTLTSENRSINLLTHKKIDELATTKYIKKNDTWRVASHESTQSKETAMKSVPLEVFKLDYLDKNPMPDLPEPER